MNRCISRDVFPLMIYRIVDDVTGSSSEFRCLLPDVYKISSVIGRSLLDSSDTSSEHNDRCRTSVMYTTSEAGSSQRSIHDTSSDSRRLLLQLCSNKYIQIIIQINVQTIEYSTFPDFRILVDGFKKPNVGSSSNILREI